MREMTLKDGRRVVVLERANFGEGWWVKPDDAKTPKEQIPFLVLDEDIA